MDPAYGNHLQRGWTPPRRCRLPCPHQKPCVGGLGPLGVRWVLLLLRAGGPQAHLGNMCILKDASEQVLLYLPVLARWGRVPLCMGAGGQGEKVVSHEGKLIQRSETKVNENRSQKWKCQELGPALVGICLAAVASPLSAPGGMLPGKKTAMGKAASPARSYSPMDGATGRDTSTRPEGKQSHPTGGARPLSDSPFAIIES